MNGDFGMRIVIVGGGTAGWMTAAALSRFLPAQRFPVTLIESDEIGVVGVGEATIPPIVNFNSLLRIDEAAFLTKTMGTFKLGIEFVDWSRKGSRYLHPFGQFGQDIEAVSFHHYWRRAVKSGFGGDLHDYCLSDVAARLGRFALPSDDPRSVMSSLKYAYHFDAGAYAAFLRELAVRQATTRIEGRIVDVVRDGESGDIREVILQDGRRIEGDFFIDCSGFRSLLIGGAMETAFRSWSNWLPCDRAAAVQSEPIRPLPPFTRATAHKAGWRWRIPLQHRTGNGSVYSSAFLSEDAATEALIENLGAQMRGSPRQLQFAAGMRERFWVGNCVAIGLSAGFLEPLESTSIHLIQLGVAKLLALMPAARDYHAERSTYNRLLAVQYERIRDFIILHYKATSRDDSEFWNYCRTMSIPDSLQEKIDLFRSSGRIVRRDDELFDVANWLAVFLGQEIEPASYDPAAEGPAADTLERMLENMRAIIRKAGEAMPEHEAFINRYCRAAKETPIPANTHI